MRFPLPQTDNLLVGLIEEHRDGVAVPNHGACERQRRALRFGGEEGTTTCSTDGATMARCGARRDGRAGLRRIDSRIDHSGLSPGNSFAASRRRGCSGFRAGTLMKPILVGDASRNGTDWWDSRLSGHEGPTPKADAADRVNDGACHHYGFGGLDLLRPFGLVALLAGLIASVVCTVAPPSPAQTGAACLSDEVRHNQ